MGKTFTETFYRPTWMSKRIMFEKSANEVNQTINYGQRYNR